MDYINSKLFVIPFLFLLSCTSTNHVQSEYQEQFQQDSTKQSRSHRTIIFFLVDGFSLNLMKEQLAEGYLPQIKNFFLNGKSHFYQARTTFPSLTYPAVSSLLTERQIEKNGIFGNLILKKDYQINFELPQNYPVLNHMIEAKNVFSRLETKGLRTVSFDYSFVANSGAHINQIDSDVAISILNKNYNIADTKLIQSLENLLKKTHPDSWPDFIFIHLVGVDFISHESGPNSQEVKSYLRKLDEQLAPVFQIIKDVDSSKKHQVITMMSADHGFDKKIIKRFDLANAIGKTDRKILLLNESRFAGVYFSQIYNKTDRASFLNHWAENENVDLVAVREGDQIFIKSHSQELDLSYVARDCKETSYAISISQQPAVCPKDFTPEQNKLYYPYFLANISSYFQTENHPDAVIIAMPGVSFRTEPVGQLGQHGGPTPQELFVPLLIRGGVLGNTSRIPALWELLGFI